MRHFIKQIKIIFLKELKDIFRDKRTMVLSIIIPLLLFPLIFYFMHRNIVKASGQNKSYKIVLSVPGKTSQQQDQHIRILKQILNHKKINLTHSPKSEKALKKGRVDLIVKYIAQMSGGKPQVKIRYNNTSTKSIFCADFVSSLLQNANHTCQHPSQTRLFHIKKASIYNPAQGNGLIILSIVLPTLLFLFSVSTTMATAADLSSGEKERHTLESLLVNPVSLHPILIGKIMTVFVIGLIGVTSFLAGIFLSYKITPDFFSQSDLSLNIHRMSIFFIIGMSLLIVLISSILELTIGFFAQTTREAQVYYLPLLIIFAALGYSTMTVHAHDMPFFYQFIPILNIALSIKALCLNIVSFPWISIVLLQGFIYISLLYFISLKIFNKQTQ